MISHVNFLFRGTEAFRDLKRESYRDDTIQVIGSTYRYLGEIKNLSLNTQTLDDVIAVKRPFDQKRIDEMRRSWTNHGTVTKIESAASFGTALYAFYRAVAPSDTSTERSANITSRVVTSFDWQRFISVDSIPPVAFWGATAVTMACLSCFFFHRGTQADREWSKWESSIYKLADQRKFCSPLYGHRDIFSFIKEKKMIGRALSRDEARDLHILDMNSLRADFIASKNCSTINEKNVDGFMDRFFNKGPLDVFSFLLLLGNEETAVQMGGPMTSNVYMDGEKAREISELFREAKGIFQQYKAFHKAAEWQLKTEEKVVLARVNNQENVIQASRKVVENMALQKAREVRDKTIDETNQDVVNRIASLHHRRRNTSLTASEREAIDKEIACLKEERDNNPRVKQANQVYRDAELLYSSLSFVAQEIIDLPMEQQREVIREQTRQKLKENDAKFYALLEKEITPRLHEIFKLYWRKRPVVNEFDEL